MDVNELLQSALSDLADGCYALQKPPEEDPDTFIVYNPERLPPGDWGDDDVTEWVDYMQVHYFARGVVDYKNPLRTLRKKLQAAGFTISDATVFFENENGGGSSGTPVSNGYTHICIYCNIEGDAYG